MMMHLLLTAYFTLGSLLGTAEKIARVEQEILAADDSATSACHALWLRYPDQTFHAGDTLYEERQADYWTGQQSQLRPTCRYLPENAEDTKDALSIVFSHNASIAIASGGHSSNTGASNIAAGVTFDLSSLTEVSLIDSKEEVWLGPGARWGDVYSTLERDNLTVPGGRLSHVGVGGYVLGGGISWFENQIGWCCDAVTEFEVVTPSLQVLLVSDTQHQDLFWALKGSLGAFGVVTRIKMRTTRNTGIYAGGIAYPQEYLPQALDALHHMAYNANDQDYTQGYISFAYVQALQDFAYYAYIVNVEGESDTHTLRTWRHVPYTHSSLRLTTIKDSAHEVSHGNEVGMRRCKFTFTMQMDHEALQDIHGCIREFSSTIRFDDKGLLGVTYQPLTLPMLRQAARENHNIFSETFATITEPLVLVSAELWWEDDELDSVFEKALRDLEQTLLDVVEARSIGHPWMYPNYAAEWQDPFGSHRLGQGTVERMRSTQIKYDPDGLWSKLVDRGWSF